MSSNIALVTDSTAYLTEEEKQEYGVEVVPLTINFEDGTMVDGIVDSREFFKRVDSCSKIPFTSQPSAGEFKECYEKLIAEGKEIISIHISGKLSGTVESARTAAGMVDESKISVVDSFLLAGGLSYLVQAAVKWVQEGQGREEIVKRLEEEKRKIKIIFTPATLEYLKKGGRIGGAQALLGTILQIKPVLIIEEGYVDILDKVRTRKKAVNRLLQEIPRDSKELYITASYVQVEEEAYQLKELVEQEVPHAEIEVKELGPVISIHGGPQLVGLIIWPHA